MNDMAVPFHVGTAAGLSSLPHSSGFLKRQVMNHSAERLLAQLVSIEKKETSGLESRQVYLAMHQPRFADILRICKDLVPDPSARVLDIGRSELTAYLSAFYLNIHTLGFDLNIDDGGHRETQDLKVVPHITFDLLKTPSVAAWPECGKFDLIVFSEVIEHLHVAPAYVLAFLGSLLTAGGVLLCTTPNAVGIAKRIRMLAGRNPYELLRLYERNPGHIREYTRDELIEIATSVGLGCRSHSYHDWIRHRKGNAFKTVVMQLLYAYPAYRPFQMLAFVRREGV
jgi:SAM-dependent methyltransferase